MKKISILIVFVMLLVVGCKKEVKDVVEKEDFIGKDIEMFMNITEESSYWDVVNMMKEAEEEGLGKYNEDSDGSYGGEFNFTFNTVNKEAEESYEYEERMTNRIMASKGLPVYKSSYKGAIIFVKYEYDRNRTKETITGVSYYAESDSEDFRSLSYSFKEGRIDDTTGVQYSKKLGQLEESAEKSEVDEFLIECVN